MENGLPLLVVGAGPKAAAIAAKSRVLRDLKESAPPVWTIDKKGLCANWTGKNGFTSGQQRLGTPPEKDIGFPYDSDKVCPLATVELFSRYSWGRWQFRKQKFGEWIDRGRPHPTHRDWADYLQWVIRTNADRTITGEIRRLVADGDRWEVDYIEKGRRKKGYFSGVVITGPGEAKVPQIPLPKHEMLMFGDNFWSNRDKLDRIGTEEDDPPMIVVGGGETSAAVVSYLIDRFANSQVKILVLTKKGTIFSRGEGYYENRMFTQSGAWQTLPPAVRREVIGRGDRGVFSLDVARKLADAYNLDHWFMEVTSVTPSDTEGNLLNVNGKIDCQLLVFAFGFDPWWFLRLFAPEERERLQGAKEEIEKEIEHDLSIPAEILPAKLYVPMVSGFAQGPGFPNLSCLGTLSDRILGRSKWEHVRG